MNNKNLLKRNGAILIDIQSELKSLGFIAYLSEKEKKDSYELLLFGKGDSKGLKIAEKNNYTFIKSFLEENGFSSLFTDPSCTRFIECHHVYPCCIKVIKENALEKKFQLLHQFLDVLEKMKTIDPLFCYAIGLNCLSLKTIHFFSFGQKTTISFNYHDGFLTATSLPKETYKDNEELLEALIEFFPKKIKQLRIKELTKPQYNLFLRLLTSFPQVNLIGSSLHQEFLNYILKKGTNLYDVEVYANRLLEKLPRERYVGFFSFSSTEQLHIFHFGEMIVIAEQSKDDIKLIHLIENGTFEDAKKWIQQRK